MSEIRHSRRTLRSIGGVFAGLIAVFILSLGTDAVLHAAGIFPPWGQSMSDALFFVATIYRTVYGIAGSYIAARLSPDRPMAHALALGLIGLVLSIVGAIATWNSELGPKWYPLALIVIAMPGAWVGGQLAKRRFTASSSL